MIHYNPQNKNNKKILFVGGRFDDTGGKPSKIAKALWNEIGYDDFHCPDFPGFEERLDGTSIFYNGGNYKDLENIASSTKYDVVFWFPDIPNDKEKLAGRIKQNNPATTLITSKRNDGRYDLGDIIAHGLKNHANLMLEIRTGQGRYSARVLDPLGNLYYEGTDFTEAGIAIRKRSDELMYNMTRVTSEKVGEAKPTPDETEFFKIVRASAERFQKIIQGVAYRERFVGNTSFRCENGFPSFRDPAGGLIYVSRRNIDKRDIGREGFVACEQGLPVKYYGDKKPSVDTPIQLKLYETLPKINYMLHGHVYIRDAQFTMHRLPCGALEEAKDIADALQSNETTRFALNLKGHGCIIGSQRPEGLTGHEFMPRPAPEDAR